MTRLIYRVEFLDGTGPYMQWRAERAGLDVTYREFLQIHQDHDYWPAPYDDGIVTDVKNLRFGFESLLALRNWFCGAERLYLSSCGLLCSCYRILPGTILHHGTKQLAFCPVWAQLRWRKPLSHI